MATKSIILTPATAVTKAERDSLYASGTANDRATMYLQNGARMARKGKGYGVDALAAILEVAPIEVWHAEFYPSSGSKENKAWLARIAKVTPKPVKVTLTKDATPKPSQAKPAPAKPAPAKPVAKPAVPADLV